MLTPLLCCLRIWLWCGRSWKPHGSKCQSVLLTANHLLLTSSWQCEAQVTRRETTQRKKNLLMKSYLLLNILPFFSCLKCRGGTPRQQPPTGLQVVLQSIPLLLSGPQRPGSCQGLSNLAGFQWVQGDWYRPYLAKVMLLSCYPSWSLIESGCTSQLQLNNKQMATSKYSQPQFKLQRWNEMIWY